MIRFFAFLLSVCLTIASCEVGTEKKKTEAAQPVPQPEPSLAIYTDTLQKLDASAPAAVEQAVGLYDQLAPHDSTGADSAASALMRFTGDVVKQRNDSLYRSNTDLTFLVVPGNAPLTDRQKAILSGFHADRLKPVSNGEGGVYLVPAYETILPTIKARTSAATDNYLDLSAKEDTTPVLRDAGLAVEMTELADRLVMTEELMNHALPGRFSAEVNRLNRFYTDVLLFGSDNSPAIGYGTKTLDERFRKGYDYLLAKYPSSKAAANVNVWLAVVDSGDEKKIAAFQKTRQ